MQISKLKVSKRKIIKHEPIDFLEGKLAKFKISFTKESLILAQDER